MIRFGLVTVLASLVLACGGMREPSSQDPVSGEQREYSQALAAPGADRAGGGPGPERVAARGPPAPADRPAAEIRLSTLAVEERREAHRLLADLAAESGDPAAQLRWLSRVRGDQADEEAATRIDAEIEQVLATLDPQQLDAAGRPPGQE